MVQVVTVTINKDELAFSAGHFTIFSATEREPLHGHNYYVSITLHCEMHQNGLAFDYRTYKHKLREICARLNRHFLLPTLSPHLKIEDADEYWHATFNHKKLIFLKEDVILMPLSNITIEELSHWFLNQILQNKKDIQAHSIHGINVQVYNGPGQSAGAHFGKLLITENNDGERS